MYKVLIISSRLDFHSRAVAWALEKHGANVVFFDTTSFSGEDMEAAFNINSVCANFEIGAITDFDAIYNRRSYPAKATSEMPAPLRKFVESEHNAFCRWMLSALPHHHNGICVDPPDRVKFAENKALQLVSAHRANLMIPETIISSSPRRIRQFSLDHPRGVVYKPLTGHFWTRAGIPRYQTQTAAIRDISVLSDASISACPGIYQEMIDKVGDIRAVVIGNRVFSALITPSGRLATDEVDHRRYLFLGDFEAKEFRLPPEVEKGLLDVTRSFGLSYSAADFALDKNGRLHFLELNPAGQFGYVEQIVPSLRILDALVKLLLRRDPVETENLPALTLSDYESTSDAADFLSEAESSDSQALRPNFVVSELHGIA